MSGKKNSKKSQHYVQKANFLTIGHKSALLFQLVDSFEKKVREQIKKENLDIKNIKNNVLTDFFHFFWDHDLKKGTAKLGFLSVQKKGHVLKLGAELLIERLKNNNTYLKISFPTDSEDFSTCADFKNFKKQLTENQSFEEKSKTEIDVILKKERRNHPVKESKPTSNKTEKRKKKKDHSHPELESIHLEELRGRGRHGRVPKKAKA